MIISENKLRKVIKSLLVEYIQDEEWADYAGALDSYHNKQKVFKELLDAISPVISDFIYKASIEGLVKRMFDANKKDPNIKKYIENEDKNGNIEIKKIRLFDKIDVGYDKENEQAAAA